MSYLTAFLFVDANTSVTHILAWDRDIRKWVIPCGVIDRPHRESVTYSPTKPLCKTCDWMTRQVFDRDAPRTSREESK